MATFNDIATVLQRFNSLPPADRYEIALLKYKHYTRRLQFHCRTIVEKKEATDWQQFWLHKAAECMPTVWVSPVLGVS